MKTLILITTLAFARCAFAAPDPVQVGMAEAKLIELKGSPLSKATMGKKAIYRWPDMEVTLVEAMVEKVQLRDRAAEKQNAAESASANARKQAAERASANARKQAAAKEGAHLASPAVSHFVQVLKNFPDGAVVEVVAYKQPSGRVRADSLQRTGGGGGVSPRGPSEILAKTGEEFFVESLNGFAVGDALEISAFPKGEKQLGTAVYGNHKLISSAPIPKTKP